MEKSIKSSIRFFYIGEIQSSESEIEREGGYTTTFQRNLLVKPSLMDAKNIFKDLYKCWTKCDIDNPRHHFWDKLLMR